MHFEKADKGIEVEGEGFLFEEHLVAKIDPGNEGVGEFLYVDKCDRGEVNGKLDEADQVDEFLMNIP